MLLGVWWGQRCEQIFTFVCNQWLPRAASTVGWGCNPHVVGSKDFPLPPAGGGHAPSRLSSATGFAAPYAADWHPSAGRDGSTGGMGSGLAALAGGLLSGTARVAAQGGLL